MGLPFDVKFVDVGEGQMGKTDLSKWHETLCSFLDSSLSCRRVLVFGESYSVSCFSIFHCNMLSFIHI